MKVKRVNDEDLESVLNYVQEYTGLDLSKKTRRREYVYARGCYSWLSRKHVKQSFANIASLIDKDHASALHLVKVIDSVIKEASECGDYYRKLIQGFDVDSVTHSHLSDQLRSEHYKDAYMELRSELERVNSLVRFFEMGLTESEIEYRKLNKDQRSDFDIMANAKIRMLKVKHEIK